MPSNNRLVSLLAQPFVNKLAGLLSSDTVEKPQDRGLLGYVLDALPPAQFPTAGRTLLETLRGKKDNISEKDFKPDEINMIRDLIDYKLSSDPLAREINYPDYFKWAKGQNKAGVVMSIGPGISSLLDPYGNIQTTLGQFKFQPTADGYDVTDEYKFNTYNQTPAGQAAVNDSGAGLFGPFGAIREYAGKHIPPGAGRRVEIRIPRPTNAK